MLIKRHVLNGIAAGRISLAFRRWKRPTVRGGGTLRTAVGVLAIESVEAIGEDDIDEDDAKRAGFSTRADLLADFGSQQEQQLYRIALRLAGDDPRVALRERDRLSDSEVAELKKRLARFDATSHVGPWTTAVLKAIGESPGTKAGNLAEELGFEKKWLKAHIRKLKELGLTESLSPGYRLSPRGRSLFKRTRRK